MGTEQDIYSLYSLETYFIAQRRECIKKSLLRLIEQSVAALTILLL